MDLKTTIAQRCPDQLEDLLKAVESLKKSIVQDNKPTPISTSMIENYDACICFYFGRLMNLGPEQMTFAKAIKLLAVPLQIMARQKKDFKAQTSKSIQNLIDMMGVYEIKNHKILAEWLLKEKKW